MLERNGSLFRLLFLGKCVSIIRCYIGCCCECAIPLKFWWHRCVRCQMLFFFDCRDFKEEKQQSVWGTQICYRMCVFSIFVKHPEKDSKSLGKCQNVTQLVQKKRNKKQNTLRFSLSFFSSSFRCFVWYANFANSPTFLVCDLHWIEHVIVRKHCSSVFLCQYILIESKSILFRHEFSIKGNWNLNGEKVFWQASWFGRHLSQVGHVHGADNDCEKKMQFFQERFRIHF